MLPLGGLQQPLAFVQVLREALGAQRPGWRRASRGFTIVEISVVLLMVATLVALAVPVYWTYLEKARVARAIADIRTIEKVLDLHELEFGVLPDTLAQVDFEFTLDPWGTPYEYLNLASVKVPGGKGGSGVAAGGNGNNGKGAWLFWSPEAAYAGEPGEKKEKARKDRFLVPINSDYDLYSKGRDGESVAPLTAAKSRDDVVRANDGAFVGLATDF